MYSLVDYEFLSAVPVHLELERATFPFVFRDLVHSQPHLIFLSECTAPFICRKREPIIGKYIALNGVAPIQTAEIVRFCGKSTAKLTAGS